MTVREAIQQVKGFRFMVEQLELCSPVGRRYLFDTSWFNSKTLLEEELECIAHVVKWLEKSENKTLIEGIENKLMQIRDIRGTVKRTALATVLDDLELFELKHFALLVEDIREIVKIWSWIQLPDLGPVVELLSPDGQRMPHFYVYDAYSLELREIRLQLKQATQECRKEEEIEALYSQSLELENRVREDLSARLHTFYEELTQALESIGWLDVILAKAKLAGKYGLVRPVIQENKWFVEGMFHPQIQTILEQEGGSFQAVDLQLEKEATIITGANMAGKTVLLKSIQLLQYLMQFGFYVSAKQAKLPMVEEVFTSIGDEQDELNGLSSFAAEMLRVNEMIKQVGTGEVLVLIDELARTTNPMEGRAIVNGVVEFLSSHQVRAIITTHYSGITAKCRKMRVKGFVENRVEKKVTLKNINEFIDYSLEEDHQEEVPQEALRIAGILGVDRSLLQRIETYLQESTPCKVKEIQ